MTMLCVHHRDTLSMPTLRGVVVCPPATDDVQLVPWPGSVLWGLLAAPTSIIAVADAIGELTDVAPADRTQHARSFLDAMLAIDAIIAVDPANEGDG